jgi:hypothetical protein
MTAGSMPVDNHAGKGGTCQLAFVVVETQNHHNAARNTPTAAPRQKAVSTSRDKSAQSTEDIVTTGSWPTNKNLHGIFHVFLSSSFMTQWPPMTPWRNLHGLVGVIWTKNGLFAARSTGERAPSHSTTHLERRVSIPKASIERVSKR